MMALFIVLWIVGQSDAVKQAIAAYFKDPGVFSTSRSGGILPDGRRVRPAAPAAGAPRRRCGRNGETEDRGRGHPEGDRGHTRFLEIQGQDPGRRHGGGPEDRSGGRLRRALLRHREGHGQARDRQAPEDDRYPSGPFAERRRRRGLHRCAPLRLHPGTRTGT